MGFIHISGIDDLNSTLFFQGCVVGRDSNERKASGMHIPRREEGIWSLLLLISVLGSSSLQDVF